MYEVLAIDFIKYKQHEFNDEKFSQNIIHQGSQYFMLDFSLLGILVYIFVFSLD
jgi:hypothetical protein